ncbi:MAG: alkyl sulfatase dimerization domain-containing protein [Dehalococcoidia bacterium]|nr:MBL fold metallo-hydrolase [Dehalococcoidia bacterium]MCA9829911.1 MBL fold metallo-hydrolase [Dehalococcoidia bacterium]MCB9486752.1 MBL fold metallo-hydrolase [Thermoflexaceae bacterium]
MPESILAFADRLWNGEVSTLDVHPVHAALPEFREGEEIAAGLHWYKGLATCNTIDSGDGLVMFDTGTRQDQQPLFESVRRWRAESPLVAAVYSHHHVDHIFGTAGFEAEATEKAWVRPQVYAHARVAGHFDRYRKTRGWNTAINRRQFAIDVARFQWPGEYRYPDVTYHERLTYSRGDLTFELHHGRGETDDATWLFVPERKWLFPGDLVIWAVPNAGNPQKVQRYCGEWAAALRQMAALKPEIMSAGHGFPLTGHDRIHALLTDTAEFLESLEEQVLTLMNTGSNLDRVLHEVEIPQRLLDKPYLRPVYDHPQFILRNIWRLYGGWYDNEPDNLLPAPRRQQAEEWVALAGGIDRVLSRAAELGEAGDYRMACHLVEMAVIARPDASEAHRLRTRIYRSRSEQAVSSMERNILNHAAQASEQGKRDLAGGW